MIQARANVVVAGLAIGFLPARVPDSRRYMHIVGLATPLRAMTHDKTSLPQPRCPTLTMKASDRDRADVPLNPLSQANSSHLPSAIPACPSYLGAFLFLASRCGGLRAKNTLSSHVDEKCWELTLNKPIALTIGSTLSALSDWLPLQSAFSVPPSLSSKKPPLA